MHLTLRPVVAIAVATLVGAAAFWHFRSTPVDTRPISLPSSFMDLAPARNQMMRTAEFEQLAREEFEGAGFAATTFGDFRSGTRPGLVINVVAARVGNTGRIDVGAAVDDRVVGNERCTTTLDYAAGGDARSTGDTQLRNGLLCWRTSPDLSVSALVMTGADKTSEMELAAAVEALYTSLDRAG